MDKVQLQTAHHQCFTQGMRNKIKSLGLNAYWLRQSVTLLLHHPNQPASCLRILRVGDTMSSKIFISKCHRLLLLKDDQSPRQVISVVIRPLEESAHQSLRTSLQSQKNRGIPWSFLGENSPKHEPPKWHARRTSKGSVPWITEQSWMKHDPKKNIIQISHNIRISHNIHW